MSQFNRITTHCLPSRWLVGDKRTACMGGDYRGPAPSGGWRRETSRQTPSCLCESGKKVAK